MKVSVIIAVYKDIEALDLILESLKIQTYQNFEVIIAEDNDDIKMARYITTIKNLDIKHTYQIDNGVQKSKSQNNAIKCSTGDYLIFIDGDCVLYKNFIENHILLSEPKHIISGRRVNLGPKYSSMLRNKSLSSLELEKKFIKKYFDIAKDAYSEKHTEQGFAIKPFGVIHKILDYRKKELSLLGCNFSCYKHAMIEINGFDEGLGNSAFAGDTDIEWRFKGKGYQTRSSKYITNQFHLYHKRKIEDYERGITNDIVNNQHNNIFKCKKGLIDFS